MSAGFVVRAYGLCIAVRAEPAEWVGRLRERLPPGATSTRSLRVDRRYEVCRAGRFIAVSRDGTTLAEVRGLPAALDVFESDLQLQVAEWSPTRVFVHAGVVGWRGRAIVMPGRSFSGKSTLVAALVRAGATYYSDEYAVLDARGRVHPFPVPLSIRRGDQRNRKASATTLGLRVGSRSLPVGFVLATRFRRAARWSPRSLAPGPALLALLSNTVPARRRPVRVLAVLRHALVSARVVRGVRGEAAEVAGRVLDAAESVRR